MLRVGNQIIGTTRLRKISPDSFTWLDTCTNPSSKAYTRFCRILAPLEHAW